LLVLPPRRLHQLDPVPPPPEVAAAYLDAEAQLWALGLQLEAAPGAEALQPPPHLQPLFAGNAQQLRLLAAVLTPPGLRPLQQQVAQPHQWQLLDQAARLVAGLAEPAQQRPAGAAAAAPAPAASTAAAEEAPPLPFAELELLLLAAHRHQHKDLLQLLAGLAASSCAEAAQLGGTGDSSGGSGSRHNTAAMQLAAAAGLLAAAAALEEQPAGGQGEAGAMRALTAALAAHCGALAGPHPDLLRDAALLLHRHARQLLAGVACLADAGAELALEVCQVLHAVFGAVELDDAALQLQCSLRAGLLLLEAGHAGAAVEVLGQALAACDAARSEALLALRGQAGAGMLWASGSRSQPGREAQELMAGGALGPGPSSCAVGHCSCAPPDSSCKPSLLPSR
jgi:hypothetical protein